MCEITRKLSHRYPQLLLPIAPETKDSSLYRNAVTRGMEIAAEPFVSGEDTLTLEETPAGLVEIWYLHNRADFVRAVQALAYKCQPVSLPDSVGAQYLGGLPNWEKIRAHRAAYLTSGGTDWSQEFRRFTADKANYTDSLILLSRGFYSGVSAGAVGLPEERWLEASLTIRKHHELTHFVYRKTFPGDIDVVRDEVLADCMGLLAAFRSYDPALARLLLGIGEGGVLPGGRITHYVDAQQMPEAVRKAEFWITALSRWLDALGNAGMEKNLFFPVTHRSISCIYR